MEYRPIPVKDVLKRMRNISSVMVDLGFFAALYGDQSLADHILRLGTEINRLKFNLMMQAGLATRNPDEAEEMVSVYQLAVSMGKISDEAEQIARVSKSKLTVRFPVGFAGTDNVVCRFRVFAQSWADGKQLAAVFKKLKTVMNVLLVRRGESWIIEPDPKFVLRGDDTLFTVGHLGNLKRFRQTMGGAEVPPPQEEVAPDHKKLVEWLAHLLNFSDLIVDLAYAALLTSSDDLAQGVVEIEEYTDKTFMEFAAQVVSDERLPPHERVALLDIGMASERISDAAREIADVILHGLEAHPIIADVLQESEERITAIRLGKDDQEKKIKDLGYEEYGAVVLAVKRGDKWHVRPSQGNFAVKEGDLLIVRYFSESGQIEEFAEELRSEEERDRIIEGIREEEIEEG